jgi:hypothetical protein
MSIDILNMLLIVLRLIPTKRVATLLEVIEKSLAHANGAPLMLLFDERHVCGLRVAVDEGQGKKSCAGEASRAASRQVEPGRKRTCQRGAANRKQWQTASNRLVTQRGSYGR